MASPPKAPTPPPIQESSDEFVSADDGLSESEDEEEEVEDSMGAINARLMATIGELSPDDQATFKVSFFVCLSCEA